MHKHGFNAIPQGNGTRIASPASTAQLQHDNAIAEPPELNITTILLDRRPDTSFQELLDHADNLIVLLVEAQRLLLATFLCMLPSGLLDGTDNGLAGSDGLRDETEHLGLDVGPVGIARLGHGDEFRSVEDGRHTVDVQQVRGQRRWVGRGDGGSRREIFEERGREVLGEDGMVRDEFQGLFLCQFNEC